ncbi:metallopeptidase family protein [Phytomonospora endophytica]|uniref:Putative Zn-dependent protease with MMP-like domain n=1 Tax=Phytomonospora endophytica TaxID=714109 RepID=A0A841FV67_9ACTN|nr:metallopeptidase family protein [Phytomonospora endophytica]MBB6036399.1 putative Zn-dependent protease with MMP-like domain [Phytomonospora endophytica]
MTRGPRPARRGHRDRRGRGLRGRLVPASVPMARTRAETFDELVLSAVDQLERHLVGRDTDEHRKAARRLREVEFAVEDVPGEFNVYDTDVLEDGQVPLARLLPAQPGTAGALPRIVLYRRPLELRGDGDELAALIKDVLTEQVANLLGIDPSDFDPPE